MIWSSTIRFTSHFYENEKDWMLCIVEFLLKPPNVSSFQFVRLTGAGQVGTHPHPVPRPTVTTLRTRTDGPCWLAQNDSDRKIDERKKRQKEWYHTYHLAAVVLYVVCFDYFNCMLFFSYHLASVVLFVWLAECGDSTVKMCVCVVCMRVWFSYRGS